MLYSVVTEICYCILIYFLSIILIFVIHDLFVFVLHIHNSNKINNCNVLFLFNCHLIVYGVFYLQTMLILYYIWFLLLTYSIWRAYLLCSKLFGNVNYCKLLSLENLSFKNQKNQIHLRFNMVYLKAYQTVGETFRKLD